jgi:hypothetical protein
MWVKFVQILNSLNGGVNLSNHKYYWCYQWPIECYINCTKSPDILIQHIVSE